MSRHSIRRRKPRVFTDLQWTPKNALRLARGARNAIARVAVKHPGDVERLLLTRARKRLNEAERELKALAQHVARKESHE